MGSISLEFLPNSLVWRCRAHLPHGTSHFVVRRNKDDAVSDLRYQLRQEFPDIDEWPVTNEG